MALHKGPVVEEIQNDGSSVVLAPIPAEKPKVAQKEENQAIALAPQGYDCLVSHSTVMKAGAAAAFVGSHAGGMIASAAAPEIAQKVSTEVQAAVKRVGDEMTQTMLKETGLDKIPGAGLLLKAEVTDLAHKAGVQAYDQTVKTVTAKGAAIGGAAAGAGTIVALEAANGLGYLYNTFVAPRFTAYFNARKEQQLALMAQQQLNKDIKEGKFTSDFDAEVVQSDDEALDGFVNLKLK